jgi:hypothetical protein
VAVPSRPSESSILLAAAVAFTLAMYGLWFAFVSVLWAGAWRTPNFIELPLAAVVVGWLFALVGAVIVAFTGARRWAARVGATAVTVLLLGFGVGRFAGHLRMNAFHAAGERAMPVVHAIERYERDHGAAPDSVDALIPAYLPAVPDDLPGLSIRTGADTAERYAGNRWVLVGDAAIGILNWDELLFLPNGDYDALANQGYRFTRLGRWVYVHAD